MSIYTVDEWWSRSISRLKRTIFDAEIKTTFLYIHPWCMFFQQNPKPLPHIIYTWHSIIYCFRSLLCTYPYISIYINKSIYTCIRNDPPKKQTRSCWKCLLKFIPTSRSTGHCRSESFSRRCGSLKVIYRDNLENKTKGGVYICIYFNKKPKQPIIHHLKYLKFMGYDNRNQGTLTGGWIGDLGSVLIFTLPSPPCICFTKAARPLSSCRRMGSQGPCINCFQYLFKELTNIPIYT